MLRPDIEILNDDSLIFKIMHERYSPILTEVVKAREIKESQELYERANNLDPLYVARDWGYMFMLTPENIAASEKEPKVFMHFTKDEHGRDVADCLYLQGSSWRVLSLALKNYDEKKQERFMESCLEHINRQLHGTSVESVVAQPPAETTKGKWSNLKAKTVQGKLAEKESRKTAAIKPRKPVAYAMQDCMVIGHEEICECLKALEVKYFGSEAEPGKLNATTFNILLNTARKYQNYSEAGGLLDCLVGIERRDLQQVSGKAALYAAQVAFGGESEGWDNRKNALHFLKKAYKRLGKDEFIKSGGPTLLRMIFNEYLGEFGIKINREGNGHEHFTDLELMKQLKAGKDMFIKFVEIYAKSQGMSPAASLTHSGAGMFKGAEQAKKEVSVPKTEYRK